jgi:hypothetical protein
MVSSSTRIRPSSLTTMPSDGFAIAQHNRSFGRRSRPRSAFGGHDHSNHNHRAAPARAFFRLSDRIMPLLMVSSSTGVDVKITKGDSAVLMSGRRAASSASVTS